jgi:outer membrane immunogenic protein
MVLSEDVSMSISRFFGAGALLGGCLASLAASGADMPVKAPVPAPVPAVSWTGFYAGVNAGYAWSEDTSVNSRARVIFDPGLIDPTAPTTAGAALTTPIPVGNGNGFIGGGQIGYNYQVRDFVAGIEADIQWLSGRGSGTIAVSAPLTLFPGNFTNASLTATNSVDWLGTVRGRVGLTITPSLLVYGTGGLAYGGVSSSTSLGEAFAGPVVTGATGTFPSFASFSQTRTGWTAGTGAEWMFSGNWSAKLEYLHYDLGSASYSTTVSNFAVAGAPFPVGTLLYTLGQTSSTTFRGDIVRVGLNYKFGVPPMVAKY